jgi:hypothetical protein
MDWGDVFSGDTLTGALGGGLTGLVASGGNPFGAAAGAIGGGALGAMRHSANDSKTGAMDAAMKQLRDLQQRQYAQRMKDLDRALAFYQPVSNYMAQSAANPWGNAPAAGPARRDQMPAPMMAPPPSIGPGGPSPAGGGFGQPPGIKLGRY